MNDLQLSVNNTDIAVKEYMGKRVVTFKDIDTVHNRAEGTARRNFNTNKMHFVEGEDYFVRNSSEAQKEFGIAAPNGLTLITESGYLLLVKSFTDELSWTVQKELVKSYFNKRDDNISQSNVDIGDRVKYYEKDGVEYPVLTISDIMSVTNLTRQVIRTRLSCSCIYGKDFKTLRTDELYKFKLRNNLSDITPGRLVIILPSGLERLHLRYGFPIMYDTKQNVLSNSVSVHITDNNISKSITALEVIAGQSAAVKNAEEREALLKCFDIVAAGIREVIRN